MKKLLTLIILILIATSAYCAEPIQLARMSPVMIAGGDMNSCVLEYTYLGGTEKTPYVAQSSAGSYTAHAFVAGSWSQITKVQLRIKVATGTVSGKTYTIQFYNNSSSLPSSKISGGECTFTGFTSGSFVMFGCVLESPITLSNGATYHVGVNTAGTYDASNAIQWSRDSDGGGAGSVYYSSSSNESSWTAGDFTSSVHMTLYSGTGCTGN